MGGKGQSGPVATNDQMVAMQQQQAAQATQANQERNARLGYGAQNIRNTFEGTPSGATPYDFSSIATGSAPAATAMYGGPATKASLPGGYSWGQLADDGSGTPTYGLYDSSGNLVDSGSRSDLASAKIYSGGGSGAQGGFGPGFYDNYRQSIMDYYMPQEGQQYNDARTSLSYSLSRAGTSDSSIAGTDIGKLANEDAINRAQIASGADTQTGALRSQVQQDEQSALNQLYSTEDPSVAANTAENMVANAQLTKPLLNPASALFAPITAGVGNALSGFTNPAAYINPGAGGMGTASTPGVNSSQGQIVNPNV